MKAISSAATRNEAMSATNVAVRPKASEKNPPTAAPANVIAPQLDPKSAFDWRSSSGSLARFGIAAFTAGVTNAARHVMITCATRPNQM
jgi:hypothetical protein